MNYNGTSDCIKCYKRVINKVSKAKLILSRGQERAQREGDTSEDPTAREAFWELEKGQMCSISKRNQRAGCGACKNCLRKGKWLDIGLMNPMTSQYKFIKRLWDAQRHLEERFIVHCVPSCWLGTIEGKKEGPCSGNVYLVEILSDIKSHKII